MEPNFELEAEPELVGASASEVTEFMTAAERRYEAIKERERGEKERGGVGWDGRMVARAA